MKKLALTLAVSSIASLVSGCSLLGATPERLEAGRSGCDPRSPVVVPFTKPFEVCKQKFPALAADYKAKEDRMASGQCDSTKGDKGCYQWTQNRWGDMRIEEKIDSQASKNITGAFAEARVAYYESIQSGQEPSVQSVRDYLIPAELEKRGGDRSMASQPYYQMILPYFFGGNQRDDFRWDSGAVQIVNGQRNWCLTKKAEAAKAYAELNAARMTAPVGQYGQQVYPQAQQMKFDSIKGGVSLICIGVDPTGMHGNQVWLSMEAGKGFNKKGGF